MFGSHNHTIKPQIEYYKAKERSRAKFSFTASIRTHNSNQERNINQKYEDCSDDLIQHTNNDNLTSSSIPKLFPKLES